MRPMHSKEKPRRLISRVDAFVRFRGKDTKIQTRIVRRSQVRNACRAIRSLGLETNLVNILLE